MSGGNGMPPPLPAPRKPRWQPLRAGLLNLYRFDYEEFHFEDGRLLLRGNNGSGKSRVLALQLPFLLDGEVRPGRVEPDADPHKRIEWHLLMGGRYADRTGYTWIEFGRREADGTERFLTLGCGMRAVAGDTGLRAHWHFLTSQRIGDSLFLQSAQRTPLSRPQLEAAIGPAGQVLSKAEEYRRAVDDALFQLGPRFGPLIELLLQLRRPQLSRKLDEDDLSRALSDALPTLSGGIIDDVAESFSSLQADRSALRDFAAVQEAVETFLGDYAGYIQLATRRRAQAVRETHSRYEAAQRALRDAERRAEEAFKRLQELAAQRSEATAALAGAEAAERTLRDSPEMRTAGELAAAKEAADKSEWAAVEAEADHDQAAKAGTAARAEAQRVQEQTAALAKRAAAALALAAGQAAAAGVAKAHAQWMSSPLVEGEAATNSPTPADGPAIAPHSGAQMALEREVGRIRRGLQRLRQREDELAAAQAALLSAEQAAQRAASELSEAREAERLARETLDRTAAELENDYERWRASLVHLAPSAAATWNASFMAWREEPDGAGPLAAAVEEARQAAEKRFLERGVELGSAVEEVRERAKELSVQITDLERGVTLPPPPPRLPRAERQGRPGAPLWRVVDFRAEVPSMVRPFLEAALEASGLLDAWLMPDGAVLASVDDHFLLLDAPELQGGHLGNVLAVAIDPEDKPASALTAHLVERVLRRIGNGPGGGGHWIAEDGRWQLGPLGGRAAKPAAEFLGEGARAEARRRQLEVLREEHARAEGRLDALNRSQEQLQQERSQAQAEAARAPRETGVLQAGLRVAESVRQAAKRLRTSREADADADRAREHRRQAAEARDRDASDMGLSEWIGRGAELDKALTAYEVSLAGLWPELRHLESARDQVAQAEARAAAARDDLARRRFRLDEARTDKEATRRRFETMRALHGATADAVTRQLAETVEAVAELKKRLDALQTEERISEGLRSGAEHDAVGATARRAECDEQRRVAIAGLRQLAEERLLGEAHPALREIEPGDWSPAYAIDLVRRRIDQHLGDVADEPAAWARGQNTIQARFQELRDHLIRRGYTPELHQSDDVVVARCPFLGRSHGMAELRDAFVAEIAQREELLRAREREAIENHLLAEAAVELVKLIRAADQWRALANEELGQRPTSAGVKFRFSWEPDPDIGFAPVRPLLLRRGELWTPAERSTLAQFLQGRIAAEQAAEEGGSGRDHLARALDYRRWHRFVVERYQDGHWKRLNRANYGTGSGGEKALALTLPRFAAAAAHYRSAAPTSPRLIMLDEAFAGIDPSMRSQCMGILAQFDLDVVMTSELEWGCYPTVPALAIYHLTTMPGIDAVGTTRYVWNGRARRQEEIPSWREAAPPERSAGEEPGPVLFAEGGGTES